MTNGQRQRAVVDSRPARLVERSFALSDQFPLQPIRVLQVGLVLAAVPGMTVLRSGYNPYPVTTALDGLVLILAALIFRRGGWAGSGPFIASVTYVSVKYVLMRLGPTPASLLDFLQAYKAYLFLGIVTIFVGRRVFPRGRLASLTKVLVAVFALKYSVSTALGTRPMVYTENNFELMLLIGLGYLSFKDLGPRRGQWLMVLGFVVILSQSRSSAVEYLVCLVALFGRLRERSWISPLLYLIGGGLAVQYIFSERMSVGGLAAIDRKLFLDVFVAETADWTAVNWLFGTSPLSPLSWEGCARLSFYRGLFSSDMQDVCYSVVLHSFALRSVFDQGLLGLMVLLVILKKALSLSDLTRRDQWTLIAIGVANSASVSGFNSEYMAVLLVIAVGISPDPCSVRDRRKPFDMDSTFAHSRPEIAS